MPNILIARFTSFNRRENCIGKVYNDMANIKPEKNETSKGYWVKKGEGEYFLAINHLSKS